MVVEEHGFKPGDRVTGDSCTDIPGPCTGTYVGPHKTIPAYTEIADDRWSAEDPHGGNVAFVYTNSLRPAGPREPSRHDDLVREIVAAAAAARHHTSSWYLPESRNWEDAKAMIAAAFRELSKQQVRFIYEGHLGTAHTPQPDELAVRIEDLDKTAKTPPKVPCPEGYHWIGQSFRYCDKCGLPAWEHAGYAGLPENADPFDGDDQSWTLKPWKPGEREAVFRNWSEPGDTLSEGDSHV